MPSERQSITHAFVVGGYKGYITAGMYEDGTLGEVFVKMAKEGSTLSGLFDGWAITLSVALQHNTPLEAILSKLENMSFIPCGFTENPEIHYAKSILDYVARWLALKFLKKDICASLPPSDAPKCDDCGELKVAVEDGWTCPGCNE